jgi:hypothetical protein
MATKPGELIVPITRELSATTHATVSTQRELIIVKTVQAAVTATAVISAQVTGLSITGTVSLSGSPVQGAYVYVFRKDTEEFVGYDTTDASGNYSVDVPANNVVYLVAVDYYDAGNAKYYGDEKSIDFQS